MRLPILPFAIVGLTAAAALSGQAQTPPTSFVCFVHAGGPAEPESIRGLYYTEVIHSADVGPVEARWKAAAAAHGVKATPECRSGPRASIEFTQEGFSRSEDRRFPVDSHFRPRKEPPRPPVWASCGYDAKDGTHALTPVFQAPDPGGSWVDWDWIKKMAAETNAQRSSRFSCDTRATPQEAEAMRQKTINYYRGNRNIVTLSPPSVALTTASSSAAPTPRPAAQTSGLTVEANTGARDAARAWDEQVKTMLAAEAQKKVQIAASQAQSDAEYKAVLAKFLAERRKQGRSQ